MHIQPHKNSFLELAKTFSRIPVWGEIEFPGLNPGRLYKEFFGEAPDSFLFESGQAPMDTARYSFCGRSNAKSLRVGGEFFRFSNNGHSSSAPWSAESCFDLMEFEPAASTEGPPHFWGGWVGYLSYDMIRRLETFALRKKKGPDLPDLCFFQVDRLFAYDHEKQTLKYIVAKKLEGEPQTHYLDCVEEIRSMEEKIVSLEDKLAGPPTEAPISRKNGGNVKGLRHDIDPEGYMAMVESAKRYISAGDIYQANLSQSFETDYDGEPFDLYLKLSQVNPAPFSGYFRFKDFSIVSSSPERLIKLENDRLETRPIAGTRPRGKTPEEDKNLSAELLLNEKEKAEHLMLVDLERNDLGRISDFGSVSVTDMMFLERYSHVIHIVSNIAAQARSDVKLSEIIRAVFPGGTITGCPKIRCMEIIEELEPAPRGLYSGSLGYIGFNRLMDLNIIIRTLVVKDGKALFHAGAGIVADSIAEKEYLETLDKASAMIQALQI